MTDKVEYVSGYKSIVQLVGQNPKYKEKYLAKYGTSIYWDHIVAVYHLTGKLNLVLDKYIFGTFMAKEQLVEVIVTHFPNYIRELTRYVFNFADKTLLGYLYPYIEKVEDFMFETLPPFTKYSFLKKSAKYKIPGLYKVLERMGEPKIGLLWIRLHGALEN